MIRLITPSDLLRVTTGSAVAVDVHVSFTDRSGAAKETPGRPHTLITTATTTPVVAGPGKPLGLRASETVTIRNTDAALACVVTVIHTDGTTAARLIALSLPAGYTLQYNDGDGWRTLG